MHSLMFEMSSQGTKSPAEHSHNIPGLRDDERKKAAEIIQVHLQESAAFLGAESTCRRTTEGIVLAGN